MNLFHAKTKLSTVTASSTPRLVSLAAATVSAAICLATPAWADPFFFTTGSTDALVGALSQPADAVHLETETADDFILNQTTSIAQATIVGLIPSGTPLANVSNVEVEIYHVFPADSANRKINVPSRTNSPSDVEIDTATRDRSVGTLDFSTRRLAQNFSIPNTVVDGIKKAPDNVTHGDGPAAGDVVEITIDFDPPIVLPASHYFFRPEVEVAGGDFKFLSAPKPLGPPDLQAWIRNSALKPDWLRIGTDIIVDTPLRLFNMTFSLTGETVQVGTPGQPNCHGKTISALAEQFGGIDAAASALGFSSVESLQSVFSTFCRP